jgi:hypothetical protein
MSVAHFYRDFHGINYGLVVFTLFTFLIPSRSGSVSKHGDRISVIEFEVGKCEIKSCHCVELFKSLGVLEPR